LKTAQKLVTKFGVFGPKTIAPKSILPKIIWSKLFVQKQFVQNPFGQKTFGQNPLGQKFFVQKQFVQNPFGQKMKLVSKINIPFHWYPLSQLRFFKVCCSIITNIKIFITLATGWARK
jgi:hypothetical protein